MPPQRKSLGFACRLLLMLPIFGSVGTIRVAPDSASLTQAGNTTESDVSPHAEGTEQRAKETIVGDSELSASERERRLIPYMAFYLPAPEIPINQNYLTQKPTQYQKPATSYPGEGPLEPPGTIPIPTAYVHMKVPAAATGSELLFQHQKHRQKQKQFPPSAGEVYRSITYGGHHPVPVPVAPPQPGDKRETAVTHLLPSGGQSTYAGPPRYRELSGHGYKSVVYKPAPPPQLRQRPQAFLPRPKPAKINLTPFTSSNTLPGHFIPIIYTPLRPTTSDDSIDYSSSSGGGNTGPTGEHATAHQQQLQQLVPHGDEYLQPPTTPAPHSAEQLPPHRSALHQVQLLSDMPSSAAGGTGTGAAEATGPEGATGSGGATGPELATAVHVTPSPIYRVVNEPSESLLPSSPPLNTFQQQQPDATHSQHQHFQPPKPHNFFDNEEISSLDNITPQQQYVMYLQQRQRYNKHQQQQRERDQEQRLYQQQQQNQLEHLFVVSSTPPPVEEIDIRVIEMQHQQQQKQPQPPQYAQHSPLRHSVHPNPEYAVPVNHQTRPQQPQRLQFIPAARPATTGNELSGGQLQQHRAQVSKQQSHFAHKHPKYSSAVPSQYTDYAIEEPKQSLEDEQHQPSPYEPPHVTPTRAPPQAAYIIITTAAPHPLEQLTGGGQAASLPRPFYQSSLQSIPQHPQRPRPTNSPIVSIHQSMVSPQYVYVTKQTLNYTAPVPTPTSTKFKSSYKYGERVKPPAKRPPANAALPRTPSPAEYYRPSAPPPPAGAPNQHRQPLPAPADPNQLPDIHSSSLAEILHKLQASNHLPHTLTPDNIDNSIKTLITILNNLKQSQTVATSPPQHHTPSEPDYDYATGVEEQPGRTQDSSPALMAPNKRPGPNTGRPGIDYPTYSEIPATAFDCGQQRYKGFFGDPETNCQVWHYCDLNGGKASFLCPNGTIFSQIALTCDWWFNVKCSTTSQLYVLNERLYKYILPFNPKFPEDYSGPIVDKYLALKFQEMEEQMRLKKVKEAPAIHEQSTEAKEGQEQHRPDTTAAANATTVAIIGPHSINSQVEEQSSERNLLLDDEVADVAQRGTAGAGYSASTQSPTTTRQIELPLSLHPIVVSSTSEPDYDRISEEVEEPQQQSSQEDSAEYASNSKEGERESASPEQTGFSVEKVEVIEIKSDGTPAVIFNNEEETKNR